MFGSVREEERGWKWKKEEWMEGGRKEVGDKYVKCVLPDFLLSASHPPAVFH